MPAQLTDRINCWTLRVQVDVDRKAGAVWCRDERSQRITRTDVRWVSGGGWRATLDALRCPPYVEGHLRGMLRKMPQPHVSSVTQRDLAALRPGSRVELELGGITLTVTGVHHGGLLVSGVNEAGRPMRVRFDAVERIVSAA